MKSPNTECEPLPVLESNLVFGAAIAALALLFIVLNAPWPMLGPDESAWMTSAIKVLDGKVLGRDAVMAKGPYLLFWHLGVYLLTGPNVIALHLLGTAWAALTGAVVCLLALRLSNRTGLLATGLFYTAAMADHALRTNVYGEVLMALPIALGFIALAHALQTGRARWTAVAGLLAALAVLTKQTAAFHALAMAAAVPICVYGRSNRPGPEARPTRQGEPEGMRESGDGAEGPGSARTLLVHWLAAAGGALVGALPWLLYLVGHGAGREFIKSFVGESSRYVTAVNGSAVLYNLQWSVLHVLPRYSLVLIAAALGIVWMLGRGRRWRVVLLLWLLAAVLSTVATGRFAAHYFSQAFPIIALVGGLWVANTQPPLSRRGHPSDGAGSGPVRLGLPVLLLIAQFLALVPIVGMNLGKWHDAVVVSSAGSSWRVVGEYLRERTTPAETIFVWGDQTEVLYWAGRELASDEPWITLQLLGFEHTGPLFAERANDEVDWRRFEIELERRQPRYVVIAPAVQTVEPPLAAAFGADDLPVLAQILKERGYRSEAVVRGYELHRLDDR